MNTSEQAAAATVRATVERVIAAGVKPGSMAGASDEQIEDWAARQGVTVIPAAVREVMRMIGIKRLGWFRGSAFGVKVIEDSDKRRAIALLSRLENTMTDSAGMLVLAEHQGYQYYVIDGADLGLPDPPVWFIDEDEIAEKISPSVTDWFDSIAPDVEQDRARLRLDRTLGSWISPGWAEYIDIDDLE
ncbi:SMI1/KNR4 family protein [Nocardia sp. NPDC004068]|uniref:SMI1/KNR4 family protein n=1 Tax=Nocardia sp. NPDC004068 TaxID=3364303 RepID=UPI0036A08CB2